MENRKLTRDEQRTKDKIWIGIVAACLLYFLYIVLTNDGSFYKMYLNEKVKYSMKTVKIIVLVFCYFFSTKTLERKLIKDKFVFKLPVFEGFKVAIRIFILFILIENFIYVINI